VGNKCICCAIFTNIGPIYSVGWGVETLLSSVDCSLITSRKVTTNLLRMQVKPKQADVNFMGWGNENGSSSDNNVDFYVTIRELLNSVLGVHPVFLRR
jgi:hypothetical protein